MTPAQQFCTELAQRLDVFYADLANYGEVAPGVRFRLEGFVEAGLFLQLVATSEVERMVADAYFSHMGEPPPSLPGKPQTYHLPVRWQRAPVFPSGGAGS